MGLSASLPTDIVIDFNSPAAPTEPDLKKVYEQCLAIGKKAADSVAVLNDYAGCEDMIRVAMSKPTDQATQITAFEGMFANVCRIRDFYLLGKEMDELLGRMVRIFVESDSLQENPALLHQFAVLLNHSLTIDRIKMMRPAIQNDFSFYRRALGKLNTHPGVPVNEIEANNISSFIAQPTPVIASLIITMDNLQRQIQVTQFLADFAHICCANVMSDKARNHNNAIFSFTAMVVALVIYDQISPTGVFSAPQVHIKVCLTQLKNSLTPEERGPLSDALQYTTKTYNRAPEAIKKLVVAR